MKHTEAFIEKHKRLIESREKAALEKFKAKTLRKEENYKKKLERQKEKYRKRKEDLEKYKEYLNYLKKYRIAHYMEKLEKRAKKIESILEGKKYGVFISKTGNIYYVRRERHGDRA